MPFSSAQTTTAAAAGKGRKRSRKASDADGAQEGNEQDGGPASADAAPSKGSKKRAKPGGKAASDGAGGRAAKPAAGAERPPQRQQRQEDPITIQDDTDEEEEERDAGALPAAPTLAPSAGRQQYPPDYEVFHGALEELVNLIAGIKGINVSRCFCGCCIRLRWRLDLNYSHPIFDPIFAFRPSHVVTPHSPRCSCSPSTAAHALLSLTSSWTPRP